MNWIAQDRQKIGHENIGEQRKRNISPRKLQRTGGGETIVAVQYGTEN